MNQRKGVCSFCSTMGWVCLMHASHDHCLSACDCSVLFRDRHWWGLQLLLEGESLDVLVMLWQVWETWTTMAVMVSISLFHCVWTSDHRVDCAVDFAVAAPFDEGGKVFIYYGTKNMSNFNTNAQQVMQQGLCWSCCCCCCCCWYAYFVAIFSCWCICCCLDDYSRADSEAGHQPD